MVYDGKWEILDENNQDRISRIEGQVWIGLRELLLNPKCATYYDITEFRMSQLVKVIRVNTFFFFFYQIPFGNIYLLIF